MAIYRVVNEAVSVPVRASLVTGQAATYEEAQDDSVLALDKFGRPALQFAAIDRGGYIYTEQTDEQKLEDADTRGTYVGASAAVSRLERKGAVVDASDEFEPQAAADASSDDSSNDDSSNDSGNKGKRGNKTNKS